MAVAPLTWADAVDGVSVINKVESTGLMAEFKGKLESASGTCGPWDIQEAVVGGPECRQQVWARH